MLARVEANFVGRHLLAPPWASVVDQPFTAQYFVPPGATHSVKA